MPMGWGRSRSVPEDKKHDLDFIVSLIDWDASPAFRHNRQLLPNLCAMRPRSHSGYLDRWVVSSPLFSSKTDHPAWTPATIQDPGAYSAIVIQDTVRWAVGM
jgi:hypothetical protein